MVKKVIGELYEERNKCNDKEIRKKQSGFYCAIKGKTYYEIDCWTASDSFYKGLDKERLGRVKGSGVVLYAIKDDTDKEIIMGQIVSENLGQKI